MRTTIDLPDALFRRAKLAALERRTTLKELVASGLEKELGISLGDGAKRLNKAPVPQKFGRMPGSLPSAIRKTVDDQG